jgi:hypothetical protein
MKIICIHNDKALVLSDADGDCSGCYFHSLTTNCTCGKEISFSICDIQNSIWVEIPLGGKE